MGDFPPLESTPAHLSYLLVSAFLIIYALFSVFIRNKLHLSEPPLALLTGIAVGPKGTGWLDTNEWGFEDDVMLEITRVIAGLQVFAIGLELPRRYILRNWSSVLWMLGPVMAFGWVVCAACIYYIFHTDLPTALTIAACLTPTDPVLASSVIGNSRFSSRVPKRIKDLISAESGCNDGISFPFLYVGLQILKTSSSGEAVKDWFLLTVFWQCLLGTVIGAALGLVANRLLRFSDSRKLIGPPSFIVFYLLLAVLSLGIASNLGLDDFLVAFAAGAAFSHDGWFFKRTREDNINNILDLLINSTFFVYLGTTIPWDSYKSHSINAYLSPGRLIGFLALVLLLRRIPIVLALKRFIPSIKTYREALFCGHFGPMGVGAIFLAMEARAFLETGTSLPLPHPDPDAPHYRAIALMWPLITFVVLGSTLVHGLSVAAISFYSWCARRFVHDQHEVQETEPLHGMLHEDMDGADEDGSETEVSDGEIALPG